MTTTISYLVDKLDSPLSPQKHKSSSFQLRKLQINFCEDVDSALVRMTIL